MDLKKFLGWFDRGTGATDTATLAPSGTVSVLESETDNPNGVDAPIDANELVKLKTELMGQLAALHNAAIVSETDLLGNITFANDLFYQYSKYTHEELIGRNHRILKSGDQPDEIFVDLWKTISRGKVWEGEVKNKAKDGSFYWVVATITPILDLETHRPIKYVSVRFDITKQKEQEERLARQNHEINSLYAKLQEAQVFLEEQLVEKASALEESVTYATRIQHSIIPKPEVLKNKVPDPFEVAVYFQPRDQVSGDFFWAGQRKNRSVLALGDSTGHGVPGAFLSILGITTLHKLVEDRGITDPSHLLDEMDAEIRNLLRQNDPNNDETIQDSIEMAVCSFVPGKSEVQFAAAMRKSYIVRVATGEVEEVAADRRPVGGTLYGDAPFNIASLHFNPGDTLYMFSDGYMTQMSPKEEGRSKKFGAKAFRDLILEVAKMSDLDEQTDHLKKILKEWKGAFVAQTDDILVMILRHKS